MTTTLVLGGPRCGKSRHAEALLSDHKTVTYVATRILQDRSADPEATARVRMVGAAGGAGDGYGDLLATNLRRQGVDASGVLRPDGLKTGIAIIVVDEPTGENRIVLSPGANHALQPADVQSLDLLRTPNPTNHHPRLPDLLIMQLEIPFATFFYNSFYATLGSFFQ